MGTAASPDAQQALRFGVRWAVVGECARLNLSSFVIDAVPAKGMDTTTNHDTESEQGAEFYALTACRILMRAESMQQGDRNGMIMGIISLAIDAARDAIKVAEIKGGK